MDTRVLRGLLPLLLGMLACQPVIAIGRNEFLFVLLVILVLLGPPLYRFIRRLEEFLKYRQKDK